jgi:hypothetical protein
MLPLLWMKKHKKSCSQMAELLELPPASGKMTVWRHSRGKIPVPDYLKQRWVRVTKGQVTAKDLIHLGELAHESKS